jgi:SH3 domain-containing YSC84-like protein 1
VKTQLLLAAIGMIGGVLLGSRPAQARATESAVVESAADVLSELMQIPHDGIPRAMLAKAEGVVIVPATIKVGLVAGVRHGRGVAVIRDQRGQWQAPVLLTMTGGSVGWQVGIQSTDNILVFQTRRSVEGLMRGKLTVGVDAAAAVGPVGRQAAAATDGRLQAEILSYSRSRGLFVGASIDGSVLQIDDAANQRFYRSGPVAAAGAPPQLPAAASRLLAALATYSGDTAPAQTDRTGTAPGPGPGWPATPPAGSSATSNDWDVSSAGVDASEATRLELAAAAEQLGTLLDEAWRRYLALPRGVFSGEGVPSVESLEQSLRRFNRVARDSLYQVLLDRAEFQQVHGLLKIYTEQVRGVMAENTR